jgi:hypothetical protein
MGDERRTVTVRQLTWWWVIGAVMLAGLGLFFAIGRSTGPVVPSPLLEKSQ